MSARGRHPHNKLTDLTMRRLRPGRYADGHGLYIFVRESGVSHWMQRIVVEGRRRDLGLGSCLLVSLADARRVALENRRIARAGGDPMLAAARKKGPTFRSVYEVVTENRRPNWDTKTTAAGWRRGFEKYVFPVIGDKPVREVTLDDVRRIVVPRWNGRNSAGYHLRQNIDAVLAYAVVAKYRLDNPASDLKCLLPKVDAPRNHQPSLPYPAAPDALTDWQALPLNETVTLAVLFIVLTASRLSEATDATWQEIDLPKRKWTVPAKRMKGRRVHEVPLSVQALEVLDKARVLERDQSLVFPFRGRTGRTRPVSQGAVSYALRKLGRVDSQGRRIVVHGFRSTFRDWASEVPQVPEEIAEAALAHAKKDRTVASYARSNLFGPRVNLMQMWADYVLPRSPAAGEG